jgi:hypothetical protein
LSDASAALERAEYAARDADALAIANEITRYRAHVMARRGNTDSADAVLRDSVDHRRHDGDEVGAIDAELDLAGLCVRRGLLSDAARLASGAGASAACRKLAGFSTRAQLVCAAVDVAELRLESARGRLARLVDEHAEEDVRVAARGLLDEVEAWTSETADYSVLERHHGRDEVERGLARARIAMAANDPTVALAAAREVAVRAERAGRSADLADALALTARLHLARGDADSAAVAAASALIEGRGSSMLRSQTNALLVLAALERDGGDIDTTSAYLTQALGIASECGLPVERLVAAEALDELAGSGAGPTTPRNPSAATMTPAAIEAADRMLTDLGLATARPYRVVSASGSASYVAGANPEVLGMTDRNLAIDAVRDVVIRDGEQVADLRRRTLLKRLLFLFASAPGQLYSKEEIVQTVWKVEYHPLNRDAALFTNIMRVRRLLGDDGADLIRASEGGYRFIPPKDFLFVEAVREP